MGEQFILVCDVCGRPAAETVTIKVGNRNFVKDFCSTHLNELTAGARAPRRGRRRAVVAGTGSSATGSTGTARRGRPKGSTTRKRSTTKRSTSKRSGAKRGGRTKSSAKTGARRGRPRKSSAQASS